MKRLHKYLYILGLICLISFSLSAQQEGGHQHSPHYRCGVTDKHMIGGRGLRALRAANFNNVAIPNDQRVRVYRLILPVDYSAYTQLFNSSTEEVKAFWNEAEEFLNTVYMRDVGIKFELIRSDKVIITEKSKEKFPNKAPDEIISNGTRILDALRPPTYDIGVWLTKTTIAEVGGLAYGGVIHGVTDDYGRPSREYTAGAMVTQRNTSTLAHEIGHMFGANHTFYQGGAIDDNTNGTESFWGESIMGYSPRHRNYFATSNIYEIRSHVQKNRGYNDRKGHSYPRIINSTNTAPKLDKTIYQASYTVPLGSFFKVDMKATDADNHKLFYAIHFAKQPRYDFASEQEAASKQFDVNAHPHFYSAPFREGSPQPLQLIPNDNGAGYAMNSYGKPYNSVFFEGDYRLWLAVRDADAAPNFKVLYDSYQTSVKIVKGIAFDILPSSNIKTNYEGGETIDLKWSVDQKVFPVGSKVRILLSDDYGKTFKHTLVAESDNDGAETITLPKGLNIGKSNSTQGAKQVGLGVIRIEVINHIVFADSHIGGKERTQDSQRYSFTLEDAPTEDAPVPTKQPIATNNGDNRVAAKVPSGYNSSNAISQGSAEHRITVQVSSGTGALDFLRLSNGLVRVMPKPASGQRVKGIRVSTPNKSEQDITATRSFTLMGDATITVEFEASSVSPALKVFPNPAVDYVNIVSKQANTTVYITTLTGIKQMLGRTDSEGLTRCYVGGYPAGSYIITVGTATQTIQIR